MSPEIMYEHIQLISVKDYSKRVHSLATFPHQHPISPHFSPYHESAVFLPSLFMPVLFVIFINSDKPIIMIISVESLLCAKHSKTHLTLLTIQALKYYYFTNSKIY